MEEHMQNKHGEKWMHVDLNARKFFSKSTASATKYAFGLSTHGERAKKIDEKSDCTEGLLLTKEES